MAADTLLEVTDLSVSFRSEKGMVHILERISFTVGAQEILSIVGESGSGKSMTSLAVMRLITDPNAVISIGYLQDGILAKVDRASMLCSLEARTPFLDLEMANLARRIPSSRPTFGSYPSTRRAFSIE